MLRNADRRAIINTPSPKPITHPIDMDDLSLLVVVTLLKPCNWRVLRANSPAVIHGVLCKIPRNGI